MNNVTPQSLQQAHRAALIVTGAMMAAVFVFAGVAEVIARTQVPFRGFSPLAEDRHRMLLYVLAGVAVLDVVTIPFIRRAILRPKGESGARAGGPAALVSAATVPSALCLSVAVYGMVLFLMNGNRGDLYFFLMASLASFLIFFPSETRWQEWTETMDRRQTILPPRMEPSPVAPPASAPASKIGGVLLGLFFLLFLVAGLLATMPITKRVIRNRELVSSGIRTTGKVIDYKMSSGKAARIWPVVSFEAADGTPRRFESLSRLKYSGYSMGQSVPVVYDGRNPDLAEIDEPERLWGGIVAGYVICGVFMLVGGGGMLFFLRTAFGKK